MVIYLNRVTDYIFGRFILLSVFIIIFIYQRQYGNARAFTVASFASTLVGGFMVAGGMLMPTDFTYTIIFLYTSIFLMAAAKKMTQE
jgi:hypothetical protein